VVGIQAGSDGFLSILPLSHCYECTCGFLAPLLAGARVYFARSLAPSEILADLGSSGATFLLSVPLIYEKFAAGIRRGLRRKGMAGKAAASLWALSAAGRPLWQNHFGRLFLKNVRAKAGLGSVRYLISGGAPLPLEVGAALEALGLKLLQGYGLTETSPVATLNPIRRANPASVGRPLPGVQVRIHNPNADGIGEVRIKGDTVTQGYWRDEEATREMFEDGWLKTGDLGLHGADDHLFITGRSKNLIITPGGKNISPEEIELAVLRSPLVAEIIVSGAPTRDGTGEEVFAYIHPDYEYLEERGIAADDAEQLDHLLRSELDRTTSRLATYKRVVRFAVSPEPFTKTTSHKIKRYLHLKETPRDRTQ
jgi:long-chain acyl-CoA synthetase